MTTFIATLWLYKVAVMLIMSVMKPLGSFKTSTSRGIVKRQTVRSDLKECNINNEEGH